MLFWLHARHFESIDDAFVDAHIVRISPRVSGVVVALHVDGNQFVHRGDMLVEIDPTDFEVARAQAQAQLENAHGQLDRAQSQICMGSTAVRGHDRLRS